MSNSILCNICECEIGLKWCSCGSKMCGSCVEKLEKFECVNCRKSLKKQIYFAGKILTNYMNYSRNIDIDRRIVILDTQDEKYIEDLCYKKNGDIPISSLFKFTEFLNLKNKLPVVEHEKHILTGPCLILNEDEDSLPQHGCFYSCFPTKDISTRVSILNKRNMEMIKKCDIFVLTINEELDCFCAMKEWGVALSNNKILVIEEEINYIDDSMATYDYSNIDMSEFYTFAQDSLDSFENIDVLMRDDIIKTIPKFKFHDWITYKCWLQSIINEKTTKEQTYSDLDSDLGEYHIGSYHIG